MEIHSCTSITDAISKALEISRNWGDDCGDETCDVWYRGANGGFDLLPSAYWKNVDEDSPFITFSQLVGNYIDTRGYDKWDFYSLARHHSMPTRLLDWSEGIMQALFFAFDNWDGKTTPCVWLMCPHELNMLTIKKDHIICPSGNEFSNMYLPEIKTNTIKDPDYGDVTNDYPIAIYPKRSNPRIHGQQGVFTLHGTKKESINSLLESMTEVKNTLTRIDLKDFKVDSVKRDLSYLGMHQATIYPDPDHLAKDLRYLYQC